MLLSTWSNYTAMTETSLESTTLTISSSLCVPGNGDPKTPGAMGAPNGGPGNNLMPPMPGAGALMGPNQVPMIRGPPPVGPRMPGKSLSRSLKSQDRIYTEETFSKMCQITLFGFKMACKCFQRKEKFITSICLLCCRYGSRSPTDGR